MFPQTYLYGGYRHYSIDFEGRSTKTMFSGPVLGVSVGF
jgi:hypothetical protein